MTTSALLALLLGTVVPALTAAFTRLHASANTKALANGMLAAVAGALSAGFLSPPKGFGEWEQIALCVLLAWVASGAAFVAAWHPTGASEAIGRRTASFGIGALRSSRQVDESS